jgi:hypothetical protein
MEYRICNLEFATRNKKFVPEVANRNKRVELFDNEYGFSLER